MNGEQRYRDALEKIKDIVVGDAHPNWSTKMDVYAARGNIADLCDKALSAPSQAAAMPVQTGEKP